MEVIAIETMTLTSVEDKVTISTVVIPREGVEFIWSGEKLFPAQTSDFIKMTFISRWTRSGKVQLTEGEYREVIAHSSGFCNTDCYETDGQF